MWIIYGASSLANDWMTKISKVNLWLAGVKQKWNRCSQIHTWGNVFHFQLYKNQTSLCLTITFYLPAGDYNLKDVTLKNDKSLNSRKSVHYQQVEILLKLEMNFFK